MRVIQRAYCGDSARGALVTMSGGLALKRYWVSSFDAMQEVCRITTTTLKLLCHAVTLVKKPTCLALTCGAASMSISSESVHWTAKLERSNCRPMFRATQDL